VVDAENITVSDGGNSNIQKAKILGVYTHARPDGTVFYVGKGDEKRAYQLSSGRNHVHKRVTAKYGYDAIIVAFMPCGSEEEAFDEEVRLIEEYRAAGNQLVNLSDGGRGGQSGRKLSAEHREKIRAALTGKKKPAGFSEKLRAANLGKRLSPEHIEKMAASKRGKRYSDAQRAAKRAAMSRPEVVAKLRAAHLGKTLSPETRDKIGAASKATPRTKEWNEKIAMSQRGRDLGPEWKARIAEANRKRFGVDAERKKISNGMKKVWNDPEYRKSAIARLTAAMNRPEVLERNRKAQLGKRETAAHRENISSGLKRYNEHWGNAWSLLYACFVVLTDRMPEHLRTPPIAKP